MNFKSEWHPSILLQSLLFKPLWQVIARLHGNKFPGLKEWNGLLERYYHGITVQHGLPLRFVEQETGRQGFESQYEPRCYLTGEVQNRHENWHDLFNALVWLTFPKAKAAINARHYHALKQTAKDTASQRGKVRDMATLLDESGVIVVSADAGLDELLCNFQWKELFWKNREHVVKNMGFYIFGHGLYEKALHPYIGMTGQGLLLKVNKEYFSLSVEEQIGYLDENIARYLHNPQNCLTTRELQPVPLLGVPEWSAGNNSEAYYDNTAYFRPGRQYVK